MKSDITREKWLIAIDSSKKFVSLSSMIYHALNEYASPSRCDLSIVNQKTDTCYMDLGYITDEKIYWYCFLWTHLSDNIQNHILVICHIIGWILILERKSNRKKQCYHINPWYFVVILKKYNWSGYVNHAYHFYNMYWTFFSEILIDMTW